MRHSIYLFACVAALGGTGAVAQGVAVDPETAIVQISAPVDRAAGNGSMGMGEGIRNEDSRMQDEEGRRTATPSEARDPDADSGHGGNETDMEHRRRPRLGDDQD